MERLFTELTPEVDYTAQMYAKGDEKQEIANKKIKAFCTINNQIMKAYEVLRVRNRSELTLAYARRLGIKKAREIVHKVQSNSTEIKQGIKKGLAVSFLIGILGFDMYYDTTSVFRTTKRVECRARRTKRNDLDIQPIIL